MRRTHRELLPRLHSRLCGCGSTHSQGTAEVKSKEALTGRRQQKHVRLGGPHLGRDQDELSLATVFCEVDDLLHGDIAAHRVHEDVEFVHHAVHAKRMFRQKTRIDGKVEVPTKTRTDNGSTDENTHERLYSANPMTLKYTNILKTRRILPSPGPRQMLILTKTQYSTGTMRPFLLKIPPPHSPLYVIQVNLPSC